MIAMTLLVRDEEDILEANLDFHLSMGVDFVIVTDHRSVDSTPEILERYRRAGLATVLKQDADTYDQARWVTKMARMAHDLGASWVINSDADEFWWPALGTLRSALAELPERYDVVSVNRRDFPPVTNETGSFSTRMIYREVTSFNLLGKPLPPKVCHRARADITVAQGNHAVTGYGIRATVDDAPIEILHFPLRTYAQFERKIASGGAAYEAEGSPAGVGETWRYAYELWRRGELRGLYADRALDTDRLAERLADETLVVDARLKETLEEIGSAPTATPVKSAARDNHP